MTAFRRRSSRWFAPAAGMWALCFAAPHAWWALGFPVGFPGGDASYHRFMASSWRYWYDVAVVVLCIGMVFVVLELRTSNSANHRRRRAARVAAWIGSAALTLRGLAGMLVDGRDDPVWWPAFLAGGVLLGVTAWRAGEPDR